MQDQDADIVRSVLCGNGDDFAKLWERYYEDAQKWAFRVTGDFLEAEEIAQEALTEALKGLKGLREPARFGGWLRQIVRNRAVTWIRRRRRTTSIETVSVNLGTDRPLALHSRYEVLSPDAAVEEEERKQRLTTALERLPGRYKKVIDMFYFKGQSQEEVAGQAGSSISAVKGLLFRARQLLREELSKNE